MTARPGAVNGVLRRLVRSPDAPAAAVVALLFLVVLAFPRRMPAGVYLSGVVFGAFAAFTVLGLVLVFRSTRVVNFAAFAVGSTAATVFALVLRFHPVARLLSGEFDGPERRIPGWALTAEYWVAAVLALLLGVLLAVAVYVVAVRRLRSAPPLVGTVATIAAGVFVANLTGYSVRTALDHQPLVARTAPPVDLSAEIGGVVFGPAELAALVLGVLALPLLELYLRRSRAGRAMRAAAENPERVATLGVDASRVTLAAWALAGLLSALAALLLVMSQGPGQTPGLDGFVAPLAALVVAGATNLRLATAAAVGIGVLQQGILWSFPQSQNVVYLALLLVVVGILLARRRRVTDRVDVTDTAWQAAREVRPVPPELAGHPDVRRMRMRTAATVAAAAVLYPFVVPTGQVSLGSQTLVLAIVGLSLLMLTGWGGLVSLGQVGLAGVGAWTVGVLAGQDVSVLLALPAAAIAGALAAFLLGLPALRIRGLFLGVVTLAAAVTVTRLLLDPQYAGRHLPATVDRPSVFGVSLDGERAYYAFCLVALAAAVAVVGGLRRSRSGRALIATRDNERAAELFGIDLVRARLQVFAVSGGLAGVAGGLLVYQQGAAESGNFAAEQSLTAFLVVVVGGLGSLAGPVMGAIFAGAVSQVPATGIAAVALPTAVLVVLLAFPGGLTQLVFGARDAALRRIALRHRIAVPSLVDRHHPGWSPDRRIHLAPADGAWAEPRYALDRHEPLTVPRVAATGKGA